ncbi:hypothetical protein FACS189481_4720 [Clostridia bacterium]|nr:hypothetical protein FACS189481_4720 [Clostridia bacterium]
MKTKKNLTLFFCGVVMTCMLCNSVCAHLYYDSSKDKLINQFETSWDREAMGTDDFLAKIEANSNREVIVSVIDSWPFYSEHPIFNGRFATTSAGNLLEVSQRFAEKHADLLEQQGERGRPGHSCGVAAMLASHASKNVKILSLPSFSGENGKRKDAINEALAVGARVLNFSLIGVFNEQPSPRPAASGRKGITASSSFQNAIEEALKKQTDCVVTIAAGNNMCEISSENNPWLAKLPPEIRNRIIVVGVVDKYDNIWESSNCGDQVDLYVPCTNIPIADYDYYEGEGYANHYSTGTSQAAPIVAATVASLMSANIPPTEAAMIVKNHLVRDGQYFNEVSKKESGMKILDLTKFNTTQQVTKTARTENQQILTGAAAWRLIRSSDGNLSIPDGVTEIEEAAFYEQTDCDYDEHRTLDMVHKVKTADLPSSVAKIGICAFSGCEKLEKIIIRNNNIEIGPWAIPPSAKVVCEHGSTAEAYANQNKLAIEYL